METAWRQVPVFISSTFRDMQAERDHLVRFVFPRLRDELLPRRIHLVDVDLRWGVTSEQNALAACREIVDECRPRFVCILGGRYGWTPPGKSRSITADEVYYGVLDRSLNDRGFAYFYFRDPTATASMAESSSCEFRESDGSPGERKLTELRQAIVDAGLYPFTYPAKFDSESGRLIGLKEFGERVYDDLLASMRSDPELSDRFAADVAAPLDEAAEEIAAVESFVEDRIQGFVLGSRDKLVEQLLEHVAATDANSYVCLTGAPGSGKSALLAYLSRHSALGRQQSTVLIRHFVGATPGSTDVALTLRRLCSELKSACPAIQDEIPDDTLKLPVAFSDFLRQAGKTHRVVILIDAVNQFRAAPELAGLRWLPEGLPGNVRIVLSSLEDPALEELRRRLRPRELELTPLTAQDGELIIDGFLHRYRKAFEADQRGALLAKADSGKPLYLLTALEELRTLGTYEQISGRIVELPETTLELFASILSRLEEDDGFRDASGRRIGREFVSRFGALLAVSRYGLSRRELVDLLAPGTPEADPAIEPDPQGNVAALLHLLRPYLMRAGVLVDFYHGQFRRPSAWMRRIRASSCWRSGSTSAGSRASSEPVGATAIRATTRGSCIRPSGRGRSSRMTSEGRTACSSCICPTSSPRPA